MGEAIAWTCYLLCAVLACMALLGARRLIQKGSSPGRALRALGVGALALGSLCAGVIPSLLGTCCGSEWGPAQAAVAMALSALA